MLAREALDPKDVGTKFLLSCGMFMCKYSF